MIALTNDWFELCFGFTAVLSLIPEGAGPGIPGKLTVLTRNSGWRNTAVNTFALDENFREWQHLMELIKGFPELCPPSRFVHAFGKYATSYTAAVDKRKMVETFGNLFAIATA